MSEQNDQPQKVAILGGGLGSMTAAWELSHAAGNYDITVYQLGWRLGGKGASGRNRQAGMADRIEEHGIHVFSGLYDNAFRMLRQAYDELDRAPDAPLGTWLDAYKPHNFMVVEELWKGKWLPWIIETPVNKELPGEPDAALFVRPSDYIHEALSVLRAVLKSGRQSPKITEEEKTGEPALPVRGIFGRLFGGLLNHDAADVFLFLSRLLAKIVAWIPGLQWLLLVLLKLTVNHIWHGIKEKLDNTESRRLWLLINFMYGNMVGAIKADIFKRGVDYLDQYDYREWLSQYIIDDTVDGCALTMDSPLAYFMYDAEFAYIGGKPDDPNIGAGSTLRTMLRMALTWKGCLLWEMQAGMGDTVFGPLYEVLRRRGVKFEYFNRVTDLRPNANGEVDEIDIDVQVQLVDPDAGYLPLFDVNGLPCWPAEPFWEQLVNGEQLQKDGVDFESYFAPGGTPRTLRLGHEFDKVVLGISIGGLPYSAASLIEASADLKKMVDQVGTVRTQAAQFWCKPTTYELGWTPMGRPIFSCFHKSLLNSWADFTHLSNRESWPATKGKFALSQQYFSGPMLDDPFYESPSGPKQKPEYLDESRGDDLAKATARQLLDDGIGWIWRDSVTSTKEPNSPFKNDLLVDNRPVIPSGSTAFDAQFFRGNVAPTERFVLTLSGTLQHRRYPDQSGFDNLVFAGDWTRNDFNIGNVEATVMSGMLAANAISGYPSKKDIVGIGFLTSKLDEDGKEL